MELNITGAFNIDNYDKSSIRHLSLIESPISASDISQLESLESLHMLSCIGAISLKDLNCLPLKSLVIKAIRHQASIDFEHLRELQLREFTYTLRERFISYDGLVGVNRDCIIFPMLELGLTKLHLCNIYVSDILMNLKSPLISLTLINCDIRSLAGISNFPMLLKLDLSYNYNIELSDELNELKSLIVFDLSNTNYLAHVLFSLNINILHAIKPEIPTDVMNELIGMRLSRIKRAL